MDVHAKNKPIGDDVDLTMWHRQRLDLLVQNLENLLNEAAIYAENREESLLIRQILIVHL